MATFLDLWNERESVFSAIAKSCMLADENRHKEYKAAIKIQSWFRGCRVRAYISYLHECATVIQAIYKAHYYRNKYKVKLKDHYEQQKQNFCNKMATTIQSLWRGYYTRKYLHNYYAQKRYLRSLILKNESVRKELIEHSESQLNEQLQREEEIQKLLRSHDARKYHYMLSTESSPGVFKCVSFENEMKLVRFSNNQMPKAKQQKQHITTSSNEGSNDLPVNRVTVDLSANTGDCRIRHQSLPPIKQKGPFRSPVEVQSQRKRPLRPSLRVTTPFNSIEQARRQVKLAEEQKIVVEDRFLPFSKVRPQYSPMLGSQTPYKQSFGSNEQFRSIDVTNLGNSQIKKRFNTLVPLIPIFEELNTTY